MRNLDVFILLEIFTFRKMKVYNRRTIKDFRDFVIRGLKEKQSYGCFINGLNTFALYSSSPELSQILFQFVRYLQYVYKIYRQF